MKKRFLAAVLALVMTAACLTACGGENKAEDKQQTTTTTTAETTTTTTKNEPDDIVSITTLKVTTAKGGVVPPSEIPQDINPGQWHEDSETTTTTTKKATTTTTTTKAKTTTKPKTTTTKAKTKATTKATTTKADLKAAAEAAFAKVKKTAKEYGWIITETSVSRSTDTQYGIYYRVELTTDKNMWGEYTIKAESLNGKVSLQDSELPMGVKTKDYDSFSITYGIDVSVNFFKENGVKKKQ